MPEIVEAHAAQPGLGADLVPEPFQPALVSRPAAARGRKHPLPGPLQPVEDVPGRLRQPGGAGPGLGIAEKKVTLAVVGPAERQDLALAASRQQEKPDNGDLLGREVPAWADSLADRRRISSSDRKRARPLRR